jgi:hypothetical protein
MTSPASNSHASDRIQRRGGSELPNSFVIGEVHCQAAVFCYKADATVERLMADLAAIAGSPPTLRGEIGSDKAAFLDSLRSWNDTCDSKGAFLCLYAHAGDTGIAPIGGDEYREHPNKSSLLISWPELVGALPQGVAYLWVLGCNTERALPKLKALKGIVHRRLLLTDSSEPWRPFIKLFAEEVSLDPIRYTSEMPAVMRERQPELAAHTRYFGPDLQPIEETSVF